VMFWRYEVLFFPVSKAKRAWNIRSLDYDPVVLHNRELSSGVGSHTSLLSTRFVELRTPVNAAYESELPFTGIKFRRLIFQCPTKEERLLMLLRSLFWERSKTQAMAFGRITSGPITVRVR
jgi:hypothetical protein